MWGGGSTAADKALFELPHVLDGGHRTAYWLPLGIGTGLERTPAQDLHRRRVQRAVLSGGS